MNMVAPLGIDEPCEDDIADTILSQGGVDAFIDAMIHDTVSLRSARALSTRCTAQLQRAAASTAIRKAHAALATTAQAGLVDARDRLSEIRSRASAVVEEHNARTTRLSGLLDTFSQLSTARNSLRSVERCRAVADAYARVLHPLVLHSRDPNAADIAMVAAGIETLIRRVEDVRSRGAGGKSVFSSDPKVEKRLISSIEQRAVDAVVKARAAFVNKLDNEFRHFGWPMNIPHPDTDAKVVASINSAISQLNHLQRAANDADYVAARTKWQVSLSDSWAIACVLRAPLARFKYHFLETFRADAADAGSTSRFDRPEWAAEFALDRIRETAPFLGQVAIDGPCAADVKFAEGFCRVFADKVAYDCELALRTSNDDADADVLIAHAAETARQFDAKLRSGVISLGRASHEHPDAPPFMSSLHMLSLNESFLTSWAISERRLADVNITRLFKRAIWSPPPSASERNDLNAVEGGITSTGNTDVVSSREELEQICIEIVSHVGTASDKCRSLDSGERITTFLKLTESKLLDSIRSRLQEEIELAEFDTMSAEQMLRVSRAAFCAFLLSDALEDRSVDPFYLKQEERLGRGFYDHDINRMRTLYSSTCTLLIDTVVASFVETVRTDYGHRTRFGEVWAPDAAIVLTHDLSEPLVEPLTVLENSLSSIARGVPCRKSASLIWRPIASKLDRFFFDDVVLQCFVGGKRNAMAAASKENKFLSSDFSARMARQVAFDSSTFVTTFSVVSTNPSLFLPRSSECGEILQAASNLVLLPSVPPKEEHEKLIGALKLVVDSEDESADSQATEVLKHGFNAVHLGPRDALELLAIAGHRFAIPLA